MANKNQIEYLDSQISHQGVLFDRDAFNAFARANGATLIHMKALRCPIGLISPTDDYRPHQEHDTCSNGHIYKYAGTVTVQFTNNSMRNNMQNFGNTEVGLVGVTLPTSYDDSGQDVLVAPYDRFYYKDGAGVIEAEDTVEAHRSGIDRLQFPIVKVEYLIDANGREYSNNDFSIENGSIKWISQTRPHYDPKLSKGTVFTCRYQFKPFFYVKSLVHEIRTASQLENGKIVTKRMPYAITLQREIAFQNQTNDPTTPISSAKEKAPSSGGFGPR